MFRYLLQGFLIIMACGALGQNPQAWFQQQQKFAVASAALAAAPGVYGFATNVVDAVSYIEVTNSAGTGDNRLLLVMVVSYVSQSTPVTNGWGSGIYSRVYCGTSQMTELCWTNYRGTDKEFAVYYLVNPPTGESTIHATNNYGAEMHGIIALTLTNAAQSSTFDTSVRTTSTINSITNTTASASNELNLGFSTFYGGIPGDTLTISAQQTLVVRQNAAANAHWLTAISKQPGAAGTVTDFFNWSRTGASGLITVGVKGP